MDQKLSRRGVLGVAGAAIGSALLGPANRWSLADDAVKPADAKPADAPRKFDLGLVTYNVAKDWDVPTILKLCKSAQIAAVELRTTHKHGVEPALSKEQRAAVRKQFTDAGVKLWGCGSVCEFHSTDQAIVEKNIEDCKRFVDLVADIGGVGVKVRPNAFPKDVPQEKTLEQIGKSLIPCGKAAESAGVEIWVEVHGPGTSHPPHMKTIMNHCGHAKVGVTWNSNPTDLKGKDIAEHFALLRPHILSCHINDLKNDAAGKYPYRELFSLLRTSGYDRYTLIEVGSSYPDPEKGEAFLKEYRALWETLAA